MKRFLSQTTDPHRIGPTAHYTAEVWRRHDLLPAGLRTPTGFALHCAMRPLNALYRRRGHRTIEHMLIARHRLLDEQLHAAVRAGRVGQVLELASGLSGRGVRFAEAYPGLLYIDSDLAPMAARKRRMLERAGLERPNHRVVAVDALASAGAESLAAVAQLLDRNRGLAVVTEGLVPYLTTDALRRLWIRLARLGSGFPQSLYLTDLNLAGDVRSRRAAGALRRVIRLAVRSQIRLHFATPQQAITALQEAGFAAVALLPATDARGMTADGRRPVVRVAAASATAEGHRDF